METKKRKYSEISKPNLTTSKIEYLECDVCKCKVCDYRFCTSPNVYCSYDCYAILALSSRNVYLDTNTFVEMKRTKSE